MPAETTASGARQGFSEPWRERLPMPRADAMSPEQSEAAQALIAGPRKGVYGPAPVPGPGICPPTKKSHSTSPPNC